MIVSVELAGLWLNAGQLINSCTQTTTMTVRIRKTLIIAVDICGRYRMVARETLSSSGFGTLGELGVIPDHPGKSVLPVISRAPRSYVK